MKRTFIAVKLDPGEDIKEAISFIRSELKNEPIRWVDLNNLHITLAFIGDTDEAMIKKVISMLKNDLAGLKEIDFDLTGFGLFKSINDPKVIWTAIENTDGLFAAHNFVKRGLESIAIKLEERQFRPHLTIGRIKDIRDKNKLQRLIQKYSGIVLQTVTVSEIVYYESILLPTGSLYKPITSIGLMKD